MAELTEYGSSYTGPQIDAAIAKADTAVQPAAFNAHKDRHMTGGADALAAADIGAASSTHAAQHKIGGADPVSSLITATLLADGWTNKTQSVTATGVTANNAIVVSAAPASLAAYGDAGVYCSSQGSGTLTFACADVPSAALTVNVLIVG